jgi:tripartite-type tricarboxylate transporter receptor subunit TctC
MIKSDISRRLVHLATGVAALACSIVLAPLSSAWSQSARTIKIVVPLAPGGAASVVARLLADQFATIPGVTAVVENRPEGGTAIGTVAVARSAPDGNTLLVTNTGILINPHLRKQEYDPLMSFAPVCKLVGVPTVLAVNSASPFRTLADLLTAARAKPSALTLATFTASGTHIAFESLKHKAKADITFVPYPGSAPAVTALLGGHVTAMMDNYVTMAEHVSAGRLRVLATFGRERTKGLDIPTVIESGIDLEYEGWFGLFAPANVPRDNLSQIASWATTALQNPDVQQKLEALGLLPPTICGEEFAASVRKSYEEFGQVIREANIKVE